MIGFLKSILEQSGPLENPDHDGPLAMAALLVKVARADWDYSDVEKDRIEAILAARYPSADARALRLEAEPVELDASDVVQFTRAIKKAVAHEDRDTVIEALWELVLADGERAHEEDTALRKIAPMLGISDVESALARQRVEARLR